MFYSADITEGLSLGDSLSDSSEGLFRRGKGGARVCRSFCQKKNNNNNNKRISKDYCCDELGDWD